MSYAVSLFFCRPNPSNQPRCRTIVAVIDSLELIINKICRKDGNKEIFKVFNSYFKESEDAEAPESPIL